MTQQNRQALRLRLARKIKGDPSKASLKGPTAPPPLRVTLIIDACMFIAAGVLALVNAPWWSFIAILGLGGPILTVYGHRAAAELGVRSRDETPRG